MRENKTSWVLFIYYSPACCDRKQRIVLCAHAHISNSNIGICVPGRGTKSTSIKSTRERNQPRNEVNPGIKSTQEENQPEHEINQGGEEINHKKTHIF